MTLHCSSSSCSATLDVPDPFTSLDAPERWVAAIRNARWTVRNGQPRCPRCAVEGR